MGRAAFLSAAALLPEYNAWARLPIPDRNESNELIRRAQTGDRKAEDNLLRRCTRFIFQRMTACARGLSRQEAQEAFQESLIRLSTCIHRFDISLGFTFLTLARYHVDAALYRVVEHKFQARGEMEKHLLFKRAKLREGLEREGVEDIDSELAKRLGITREKLALIEQRLNFTGCLMSLDAPVGDEGRPLDEMVGDPNTIPQDELVIKSENEQRLRELADRFLIPRRQRDSQIFRQRLLDGRTLQEVADGLGLSRQRVQQIEDSMLELFILYARRHGLNVEGRPAPSEGAELFSCSTCYFSTVDAEEAKRHAAEHASSKRRGPPPATQAPPQGPPKEAVEDTMGENKTLTANNRTMSIKDWAKESGLTEACIRARIKLGWRSEDIINTPSRASTPRAPRVDKPEGETETQRPVCEMSRLDIIDEMRRLEQRLTPLTKKLDVLLAERAALTERQTALITALQAA